ncbi:MAG: hypothetical protein ACXWZ3_10470 [Solirubrobacterales bacterium]
MSKNVEPSFAGAVLKPPPTAIRPFGQVGVTVTLAPSAVVTPLAVTTLVCGAFGFFGFAAALRGLASAATAAIAASNRTLPYRP